MHWLHTSRYAVMNKFFKNVKRFFTRIFCGRNSLYYINGNDTLPPPLDPETEERMIDNIATNEAKCIRISNK